MIENTIIHKPIIGEIKATISPIRKVLHADKAHNPCFISLIQLTFVFVHLRNNYRE